MVSPSPLATAEAKVVLAINAGSSSVKISLYLVERQSSPNHIAEAQVSGLTAPPVQLSYSRCGTRVFKNKEVKENIHNQDEAFAILLRSLIDDDKLESVSSEADIGIACHRIVHGGGYAEAQIITKDTYHHIEQLSDLAPLHNGPALTIVDSCIKQLPDAVNLACFDTQFHSSIRSHIATYPIDREIARKNGLRKYGFHGISYAFITRSVADFLGKDANELNIIALHLGSGASACAIKGGRSWDTSMGLTPVSGLPGATRSGNVDPSLVFHLNSDAGKIWPASTSKLHISRAEEILNKQSGWKSLTGTTDFRSISASYHTSKSVNDDDGDSTNRRLAFDIFVDRICGFIGAYFVSLEGKVDALVFAGGIGEKSDVLRAAVTGRCGCLGFSLDEAKNRNSITEVVLDIGREGLGSRVLVCQTDEQYEMARIVAVKADLWT